MSRLPASVIVAIRLLARRPGLSFGRALTVTIVVTAITAVFAVANATFLRPLPFPESDRLVRVYLQPPGTDTFDNANPLHPLTFVRLRERQRAFERFEGIWAAPRAVAGDGDPESVTAGRVSAGFFAVLGARPIAGRVFTEDEVRSNAPVVVLSHGFWARRFGGDRGAIGRTLLIDREPHTIIGVLDRRFEPAYAPSEFWTPLWLPNPAAINATRVQTIGLLRPEGTIEQAAAGLETLLDTVREEAPVMLKGWSAGVRDLREAQFGSQRPAIIALLAAVIGLGLIAVANLANLTLADVMFRRGDFAVRAALGGSRLDLAVPEIVQSLIIAIAGGAAGIVGAAWLVPALLALDSSGAVIGSTVTTDWRVAACGFGVAIAVMLAAVAAPVLRLAGPRLASDVTGASRRAIGGRAAQRVRITLVVAQTALALVLLSSGALIATSFSRAAESDPGFDAANVMTAQLQLPESAYATHESRAVFVDQVLQRLRAIPGVIGAGSTQNPFITLFSFQTLVHVEDRPTANGEPYTVQFRRVTPGYFETARIRLVRGRFFDSRDVDKGQLVAIVSRGFARRFWGDGDPIGRRIRRGPQSAGWSVVIGVVDDVRDVALGQEPADTVYSSYFQGSTSIAPVSLVIRTQGEPTAFAESIRRAVWSVDPKQPLSNMITLQQFLDTTLGPQRFRAILVGACGIIGLLLATIGTYGVTARAVVERTREVGIRLALGGNPWSVWWQVAASSLRAVAAGALAGALTSAVAGMALSSLLPELKDTSWVHGALAGAVLVAVGMIAALVAARAAATVEPLRALRTE